MDSDHALRASSMPPSAVEPHAFEGVALALSGRVRTPLSLSLAQLRAFPATLTEPFDLRCYTTNRFIRPIARYRGARLTDLIDAAGLPNDPPGEFKRTVFVASARDGYAVTFSWHELFNTPVGEHVIVAYECDGVPLDPADGAPILFSGADLLPAPRHVKRLARLDARVLHADG